MSDIPQIVEGAPWRSQVFRLVGALFTADSLNYYTMTEANQQLVLEGIDIVHVAGGSGDACAVGYTIVGPGFLPLMGGYTGAGVFDNFHWRGAAPIVYSDAIGIEISGGHWIVTVTGHFEPLPLAV